MRIDNLSREPAEFLLNDMLTKLEGITADFVFTDVLNGIIPRERVYENAVYLAAAAILLHKYTQNQIIRLAAAEHTSQYSELSLYSFDFTHMTMVSEVISHCRQSKKQIIFESQNEQCHEKWKNSLDKCKADIPFYLEIFCEDYKNSSMDEINFPVRLKIMKSKNEFRLNLTSEKYKLIRLLQHYYTILKGISDNLFYDQIKMLSDEEIKMQMIEWNHTKIDFPEKKCLHHFFEENSLKYPNHSAVIFEGNFVSYDWLNQRANQLARLIQMKYKPGRVIIALYAEKNVEMIVGILAILKSGCSYLPIDSKYPAERIQYMLQDSKTELILTQGNLKKNIENKVKTNLIAIDEEWEEILKCDCSNLNFVVASDDTAYVIYTSGSTGKPKGVVLNHRGRVNNFFDFNKRFHIGVKDRILAVSSVGFDMCAYDVLGTLMAGATVVLPNQDMEVQPFHWLSLIDEQQVTIWHSVPLLLEMLCKSKAARKNKSLESIRLVLLGGDWISVKLSDKFREFNRNAVLISLGGATEASMDSIIYEIKEVSESWVSIPYGRPMYNQKAYILDEKLNFLPQGVIGELYIGGVGVADGYYNRKELTQERFLNLNYGGITDRIYKTGDLARFLEDGCIQLIGRNDFQVKIDGVRIELGEIEKKILEYQGVKAVVCLAVNGFDGRKKLVAAVEVKEFEIEQKAWVSGIKNFLKHGFSEKFIPEYYVFWDRLPVTPNGKIDRNQLLEKAVEKVKEYSI